MINGIDLSKLRNAEYLQLMKNVSALVAANDANALQLTDAKAQLDAQVLALDTLFKVSQASAITAGIEVLDARRDKAITGISALIRSYVYHFEPGMADAAHQLDTHLLVYGDGVARENYQAETATLNAILADWKQKPELNAAIALLGLTAWQAELADANTLFDQMYLARTQEFGSASPDTLRSEREETNVAYYRLRDRLAAFATIHDSEPPYAKAVNDLNALLVQYNALLRNRQPEAPAAE